VRRHRQRNPFETQNQNQPIGTVSADSSDIAINFTPIDIAVIPHIANVPNINVQGEPEAAIVSDATDVSVEPVADQVIDFGGDFSEPSAEVFTMEDAEDFSEMIWNMPAMFMGDHLEPDPAKLKKFSRELYKYCSKKGIDPSEYLFDELPLMMVGGTMGLTMWRAHKDHKNGDSHDVQSISPEPIRDDRILENPVKTANDDGIIQGVT